MGEPNDNLMDTLKVYSATKYAKTRAEVEKEIQARWSAAEKAKGGEIGSLDDLESDVIQETAIRQPSSQNTPPSPKEKPKKGFLDGWLAKKSASKKEMAPESDSSSVEDNSPASHKIRHKSSDKSTTKTNTGSDQPQEVVFKIR